MRFSDFLLVSDPTDLDFIVGYTDEQNIRINVLDLFAGQIIGGGTPGYVPVFTAENVIDDSVIFQHGTNIVIGGVDSLGYKLAVSGSLYASNGAVINSTALGADALRVIAVDGDIFVIPNDLGQSISSLRRIAHPPAVLTTESATLGQLNTAISNLEGDIEILLDLKVDKSSVGEPNGVASLDATGKIPLSEIPDSIIGQVEYMGTWNAFTNTPTLNPLIPEQKGHYYVVSAAGVFGGVDYQVGDWIISNGVEWQKVDNTDAVTSVFGRIGAILALEADYQSFYPRLSQAYDNPTWINTIAFSKITGVPPFLLENQTITLSGDVTGSGKTSIASTISNNAVTDSKLRDSVGTSVIGRASSTTGDPADIQALTDGHVLQRSGGTLLFGLISSDSIGSIDWSKIINTPSTLSGYGITDAYTKTETDNKFVPYTGANSNVNLGSNNITANAFVKVGGTSAQFLKADGSVDVSQYVPTTRSVNAGTGLTGGGNLSSDVTISFDTTWGDTRYAYRTRQLTINGVSYDLSADRTWIVGTVNTLTTNGTSGPATLVGNTLNIPNYTPDLSGYVTLATDQTVTGLKTIVRSGDVLNFKIGADTLYGLKLFYSQNEISPSGEATWSFVNTFNRDGSGYEVTPLSFFRGVLVTGERLVTSSINANLLDYYANNPTGRYPVYAYNTGVQQFANAIVVGETNGIVNAISGAISDLPSGVVANFKGRVIGSNAVNSNEFVTLGQIPTLTGYVPYTGATQSVNLGEYGLTTGFLGFDLTPTGTPTTVGTMYWDPAYRTASLITGTGATTLQVGQEEVVLVHNNTGSALTDGQVVYVTGSTGNLPSVSLADASLESTSAATLGVVTETIANGADGFVTLSGIVNGLNTLAYNEGDLLWLSETAGQFTNIKPVSPAHLVLIGYVIKRAGGNGSIFVKIQNTQELAESSDVLISAPEVDGQGLFLQTVSGVQLWRNRSIADVLGYTPANAATTLTINGTAFDLSANRSWTVGDVRTDGSYSNPSWITALAWSKITGTPTTLSGYGITDAVQTSRTITINGVTQDLSANRTFNVGTVTSVTATSPLFSSGGATPNITIQQASGSQSGFLSSTDWTTFNNKQNALTNPVTGTGTTNYLPKFTGASTIGNSQVFDNGTNVGIGTTSPTAKLDVLGVFRSLMPSDPLSGMITAKILSYSINPYGLIFRGYDSGVNSIQTQRESNDSELYGLSLQPLGGNVLIGTTTDAGQRLQVNGSIKSGFANTSALLVQSNGTATTGAAIAIQQLTPEGDTIIFGDYEPYAEYGIIARNVLDSIDFTGGSTNGSLDSYNITNRTGNTRTAYVKARIGLDSGISSFGGNVGIRTTSPSAPLHLVTPTGVNFQNAIRFEKAGGYGEVNLENYYTTGSNYGFGIDVAGTTMMVVNNLGNVGIGTSSPATRLMVQDSGNTFVGHFSGLNQTNGVAIGTNSLNVAVIQGYTRTFSATNNIALQTDGGNLLVGTTTDNGARLQVSGDQTINATQTYTLSLNNTAQDTRMQFQVNGTQTFQLSSSSSQVNIFGTANIPMIFYTNSTERMRITSGGDVGIGTSTPDVFGRFYTRTFGISSSSSTAIQINGGSGGYGQIDFGAAGVRTAGISASANETQWGSVTAIPAIIYTNGSERMRITSSGNVGIGYTSPTYQLQVLNTIGLRANGTSFQSIKGTYWGYSTSYPVVMLGDSNTANFTTVSIGYDPSANANGAFSGDGREVLFRRGAQFVTPNAANNAFNLYNLVLLDGNVGIGTSSPSYRLVVNSGTDGISAGVAGSTYGIRFDNGGTFSSGMSTIHGVDSTLVGSYQPIMLNGLDVRFGTSANERMRITSGGNVLIGTTTDVGARLYVDGAFRTGTLTAGTQTAAVDWRLGNARGGTATANALVRVQINGVLVDLIGNYV